MIGIDALMQVEYVVRNEIECGKKHRGAFSSGQKNNNNILIISMILF